MGCYSVRVLVVIPDNAFLTSGDKANGVKDMATIISNFCPDLNKVDDAIQIYINRTKNIEK